MTASEKVFLGVVVYVLGIILLVVAGGVWFWKRHGTSMIDDSKAAYVQGTREGSATDEKGCLEAAISRYQERRGFANGIANNVRLGSCLDASRAVPDFCQSVPSADNPFLLATFSAQRCEQSGLKNDPFCPQMFQQVAKYCSSEGRRTKSADFEPPG